MTLAAEARVLAFRRRRFAARRKRPPLALVLLRPFLLAAVLVGLPLCGAGWFARSPRFQFRALAVEESPHVPARWVEQALAPFHGRNLLALSLVAVEGRLRRHPWVRAVEIEKRLPDALALRVFEREPAVLLRRRTDLYYADAQGAPIAPFEPGSGPADLLLVSAAAVPEGEAVVRALALAERLARLDPEWARGLSEVEVLGDGDCRLHLAALPFPLLVNAGRLERSLAELRRVLPQILDRYGGLGAVDLRFPGQIVIQPAVEPLTRERGGNA